MANDEKVPGKCNHPVDNGYCSRTTLDNADKCRVHIGTKALPNMSHGVYATRQHYYEKCTAEEQAWIDAIVSSFLDDAPFDATDFGKFQRLRNVAIDMHKIRNANSYIADEGIQKDQVVGTDEDGNAIMKTDEHKLNVAIDRLERTTTKELKELGVLDDPDSKKAESQSSIAKELSKLNNDS